MSKIKITFFQRKRLNSGNFSLEFIFEDVRNRLKDKIDDKVKILSYHSKGFFPRLYNTVECIFYQSTINHVTGDTSYVGIFLNPTKTIQTILDCGFLENRTRIERFILWLFWLYLPIKRSKKVTTISEFVKQHILENIKCDSNKIIVIPVAVSEIYKPVPKEFNKSYPRLLQIGTAHNKNILRLVEAIKGISCHLTIIGKIPENLQEALLANKIDYANFVNLSQQEIYEKYIDCDILTFVSTYEGFGMPIIEANCVERVVMTGNTASMPEVAGNAACLVNPFSVDEIKEGIQKIINDDAYRNKLIQNGRVNRERFNPEVIASAYLEIYKKVLEEV